jgi:hypothetical protein
MSFYRNREERKTGEQKIRDTDVGDGKREVEEKKNK